jgi:O-antigen/teichoic acid export membrane protein
MRVKFGWVKKVFTFSGIFFLQFTNLISQLVVLPIVINHGETVSVGAFFLALSYASLVGILINFGSNQTSIIELQRAKLDKDDLKLKRAYSSAFAIRFFPMLFCLAVSFFLGYNIDFGHYFLMCSFSIIAEFLSPLFYLIAFQQLKFYVLVNFIFKVLSFLFIWTLRNNDWLVSIAILLPGVTMIIQNLIMLSVIRRHNGLSVSFSISNDTRREMMKQIPVVANNLTVHLQQSVFLFSISGIGSPVFLSAYGFIDKIVGSFRLVISSFNASFIPMATSAHHSGFGNWRILRNKHNLVITILSLLLGAVLFLFSEELVRLFLFGGKEKTVEFISLAGKLLRMISLVPLLIALNALNIMELLMENRFNDYLLAGIIVLLFSASGAVFTHLGLQTAYLGFYPIYIESISLLIYLFFVLRNRKNHL